MADEVVGRLDPLPRDGAGRHFDPVRLEGAVNAVDVGGSFEILERGGPRGDAHGVTSRRVAGLSTQERVLDHDAALRWHAERLRREEVEVGRGLLGDRVPIVADHLVEQPEQLWVVGEQFADLVRRIVRDDRELQALLLRRPQDFQDARIEGEDRLGACLLVSLNEPMDEFLPALRGRLHVAERPEDAAPELGEVVREEFADRRPIHLGARIDDRLEELVAEFEVLAQGIQQDTIHVPQDGGGVVGDDEAVGEVQRSRSR